MNLLQLRWIEAPQIDGDFSNTSNAHTIASHKPPTSTGGSRVKGAEPIKIKNTSALVLPLRRLPPGTHLCLWGEMCPENLGWWKEGGWTERNGVTWGVRANKKCLRSDALEARGSWPKHLSSLWGNERNVMKWSDADWVNRPSMSFISPLCDLKRTLWLASEMGRRCGQPKCARHI